MERIYITKGIRTMTDKWVIRTIHKSEYHEEYWIEYSYPATLFSEKSGELKHQPIRKFSTNNYADALMLKQALEEYGSDWKEAYLDSVNLRTEAVKRAEELKQELQAKEYMCDRLIYALGEIYAEDEDGFILDNHTMYEIAEKAIQAYNESKDKNDEAQ